VNIIQTILLVYQKKVNIFVKKSIFLALRNSFSLSSWVPAKGSSDTLDKGI